MKREGQRDRKRFTRGNCPAVHPQEDFRSFLDVKWSEDVTTILYSFGQAMAGGKHAFVTAAVFFGLRGARVSCGVTTAGMVAQTTVQCSAVQRGYILYMIST